MLKIAVMAGLSVALLTSTAAAAQGSNQTAASPSAPASPPSGGAGSGTPTNGTDVIGSRPAPSSSTVRPQSNANPASPNAAQHASNAAAHTGQRTLAQCRAMSSSNLKSDPVCGKMMSGASPH